MEDNKNIIGGIDGEDNTPDVADNIGEPNTENNAESNDEVVAETTADAPVEESVEDTPAEETVVDAPAEEVSTEETPAEENSEDKGEEKKGFFGKVINLIKAKKVIFIIIAVVLILGIVAGIVLPGILGGDGGSHGDQGGSNQGNTEYTVNLKTAGNMAMADIDVYVYDSAEMDNLLDYKKTGETGSVTFNLDESDEYAITLSGVPKGYAVEESYSFTGTIADIVLTSSLITDGDLSTATLGLGDVMYDFTVTTAEGEEFTLSEELKEKDLVILNFWYTTCSWCVEEFPVINEVYQEYSDDVAVIALDPMDDAVAVEAFWKQYGYAFPMASCPTSWSATFGITGYPTSVFIDRYGVICCIEAGAITSKRPFYSAFDHFTADPYEQMLCTGGIGDLVTQIKPTYTMDTSENISKLINVGDIEVTYRPETEDENAEYIWPFIAGEKLGEDCIYASNIGIDDSYAIIYADVTLKKGQAVGFDYLASSERLCDVLYVIVDDEDVFQISGTSETEEWKTCYPCVAEEDGVYEIALCFLKDSDGADGDDTVYVDNMRVVNESEIDVATYLPREAATTTDGDTYTYVDIVYNETDGYYHVGTKNGPLLLATLMDYSQFSEENTVYDIVYNGDADKDGISLYDNPEDGGAGMVQYFSYASNSTLNGVCTVNKELAEMLKQVAEVAGFEDDENEWLKICKYYQAYGKGAEQLKDPIKGLAGFSAYETVVGKDVPTNSFYYDRAIIPRGMFSKFVPTQSGVYRFTSKSDYEDGIEAWVFDENCQLVYTYAHDERMFDDLKNCSIVYYMEAGKTYYINMAFWDIYHVGTINYDVEFLGSTYNHFRAASPGFFTYDTDATGSAMYDVIDGGITPELKDGKYYDSKGGSLIYADFTGLTNIFDRSITTMIDMGSFDFSKTESDDEILFYLEKNDNDIEKTKEYLEEFWGEEYDDYAELYQIEDVFEGKYHGNGEDYTEEMRGYLSKIDTSGTERDGCVVVDERLAEILTELMDKFTFEDVENSWLKLCYYYDYMG